MYAMQNPYDLSPIPAQVAQVLTDFGAAQQAQQRHIGPQVDAAASALADYIAGGKRIRPLMVIAGFLATRDLLSPAHRMNPIPTPVITAASALELIQAAALIHDDIIDASDTRRGKPALHRQFEAAHQRQNFTGDSAAFGEAIAILAGDLALAWANQLFYEATASWEQMRSAAATWFAMQHEVVGGQMLDIAVEAQGVADVTAALTVARFKTAAYTIERPLHLGACFAGANETIIQALHTFGINLGIAFQLRDDLLGVFGDPATTGKPAGDDLREGKQTVLVAAALAKLPAPAAKQLTAGLGKETDPQAIAELTKLIASSGAIDFVEDLIASCTIKAQAALAELPLSEPARAMLTQLADQATQRKK